MVILSCVASFVVFVLVGWVIVGLASAFNRMTTLERVKRMTGPVAPAS